MYFVNFSNHPSKNWDKRQRDTAFSQYCAEEIKDVPFPSVNPGADEAEICALAEKCAGEILSLNPSAVMVQGEFGLAFAVTKRLTEKRIPVVYACSERKVKEIATADGTYKKEVGFEFVRFRRYEA